MMCPPSAFICRMLRKLLSWAESTSWVTMLSMWFRQSGQRPLRRQGLADPTCTGLNQEDFAFTDIFAQFTSGGGNISPQITMRSPLEGDIFDPGDTIVLSADTTDSDGTVVQVEFFAGDVSLGLDLEFPYELSWENVSEGVYTITAVATDNQGATGRSTAIEITVGGGVSPSTWDPSQSTQPVMKSVTTESPGRLNGGPGVKNPARRASGACGKKWDGATAISPPRSPSPRLRRETIFEPGDTVALSADATDSDGTVIQVEFFADGVSLGVDLDFPFALSWEDIPKGVYTITAAATDNKGATGQSTAIQITVGKTVVPAPPGALRKSTWAR